MRLAFLPRKCVFEHFWKMPKKLSRPLNSVFSILRAVRHIFRDFSGSSDYKESACNAGDRGLIPGSEKSSGKGNGNPLQYSCLENPLDRGPWWATVHEVTKSRTRLSE